MLGTTTETIATIVKEKIAADFSALSGGRPIDDTYTAFDITDNGLLFRQWYAILDTKTKKVYFVDSALPDAVNVARIKRGLETAN